MNEFERESILHERQEELGAIRDRIEVSRMAKALDARPSTASKSKRGPSARRSQPSGAVSAKAASLAKLKEQRDHKRRKAERVSLTSTLYFSV